VPATPPRDPRQARSLLATAPFPTSLQRLVERIEAAGFEAYLVGGCVRDVLLGRPLSDFDVATSAPPERVQALFRRTIPTGIEHGTVTVLLDRGRTTVEVTTYRGEADYRDGRRPERVTFHGDLHADLARRDFTVNAFAYHPLHGTFVDDFDGLGDLAHRRLRAIGSAEQRFREDGLRPMRAVRFCATLSFTLDPDTEAAIPRTLDVFSKVAAERIHDELWKLLAAPRPSLGLAPMHRTGLWARTLPAPEPAALDDRLAWVDRLPCDPVLRLAALLAERSDRTVADALQRLRASRRDTARVRAVLDPRARLLVTEDDPAVIRRAAAALGHAAVRDALDLFDAAGPVRRRVERALEGAALSVRELRVGGRDLAQAGIVPPGPAMGRCLAALLDWVLEDPSRNDRARLLDHARACCGGADP